MSGDLAAFIAARLDEDQAAALAIGGAHEQEWDAAGPPEAAYVADGHDDIIVTEWPRERPPEHGAVTAHIARHDPARALREVAAGRAILAECRGYGGMQLRLLQHLAAVWSDHPDYRPEWQFDVRLPIR